MKSDFLLIKCDGWTGTLSRHWVLTVFLSSLVNLLKECNLSPSSRFVQVTVKFVEPRTYFVDFWQLPPSGFAVCTGPTALFSALKDERSGTDGGTSEGRWQRCPVMLGSATKGQWHSNGLKLCVWKLMTTTLIMVVCLWVELCAISSLKCTDCNADGGASL